MNDQDIFAIELALAGTSVEREAVERAKEAAHSSLYASLCLLRHRWTIDESLLKEAIEACRPVRAEPIDELIQWTMTTDRKRSQAGKARLWEIGSEAVFERAAQMSRSDNWVEREKAAEILSGLGGPRLPFRASSRPILEALLADRDKDVVAAAARAMTKAKDPNLVTELLRLKHHPSIEVRVEVAEGLSGSSGPDVREALLDMLCARERQVRIAAALSLGTMQSDEGIVAALVAVKSDKDPRVRGAALYSLALLQVENTVQFIKDELAEQNTDRYTILAACKVSDKELYEALRAQSLWIDMDEKLVYEALLACDPKRATREKLQPRTVRVIVEEALAQEDKPMAIGEAVRILTYRQEVDCYEIARELIRKQEPIAKKFGEELLHTMASFSRGEDCVACGKSWFSSVFARLAKWDWRRRIFTSKELNDLCKKQLNSHWSKNPPVCTDGVHVMCLDIAKLHEFAAVIGLSPRLFTEHYHHPHYDLMTLDARQRALSAGAIPMSSKELLRTFSSGRLKGRVKTLFKNWKRASPIS